MQRLRTYARGGCKRLRCAAACSRCAVLPPASAVCATRCAGRGDRPWPCSARCTVSRSTCEHEARGSLTDVGVRVCADGTFMPEVGVARRGRAAGGLAAVAVAALALAMVALVYANTSSEWPASVMMSEGQRTTKLAWGGFTLDMQKEADKALRLCKVGLLGKGQHCATHVVSTEDSKWTHTDAGQPIWEESTNVLDSQVTKTHAYTHTTYVCVSIMCFVYAHTCW